jgi:hypothetical protein
MSDKAAYGIPIFLANYRNYVNWRDSEIGKVCFDRPLNNCVWTLSIAFDAWRGTKESWQKQ